MFLKPVTSELSGFHERTDNCDLKEKLALKSVDVMSVAVIRMTVARQSLNKAYSVSHQNQRKKLRRHRLKGP